ncbi:hypothetical protein [Streptomyces sp. B1I3]|uniref:hypothetical protein n=1 Tax=Streptomyces sp. B1I3 TaxID=3042264 RepID=UPI00278A1393|nr:hypothetical protein [Streptomyces sp. B1I3]MDQ0791718.1 hypothetical protein [Streptomyces sp. B1I3]
MDSPADAATGCVDSLSETAATNREKPVIRDLYDVRVQPAEGGSTPLTEEEEQRARVVLFSDLGNAIAERGWVRFPAYSPEERRRLVDVAHRLSAHWGQHVFIEAEDECAMKLYLAGHGSQSMHAPLP